MPAKKHHVTLTPEQRERAEIIARSYKHSDRERKRARILLLCDTAQEGGACKVARIDQPQTARPGRTRRSVSCRHDVQRSARRSGALEPASIG